MRDTDIEGPALFSLRDVELRADKDDDVAVIDSPSL